MEGGDQDVTQNYDRLRSLARYLAYNHTRCSRIVDSSNGQCTLLPESFASTVFPRTSCPSTPVDLPVFPPSLSLCVCVAQHDKSKQQDLLVHISTRGLLRSACFHTNRERTTPTAGIASPRELQHCHGYANARETQTCSSLPTRSFALSLTGSESGKAYTLARMRR